MAKTPGKIGQGRPETSASLIASEEVLFGQPTEYNSSDDEKGDIYDGGNFAGVAVYDPSKGASNTDRSYESDDVMEVLREGVAKVRINSLEWNGTPYYSYFSAGDPIYAQPSGYVSDKAYFWGDPTEAIDASGNTNDVGAGYFGHAVGEALESVKQADGGSNVILVDFNQPDVN